MTTLLKTISVAAGVAMAAFTYTGVAQAEDRAVRIQLADLNLATPEGHAAYEFRVQRAARSLCEDFAEMSTNSACQRAVREEANENLRQQQLASQGGMAVAARR